MVQVRQLRATTATAHAAALDEGAGSAIERYWELIHHPFRTTPDLEYAYESDGYREALARVLYNVVELGGGLTVVTGAAGTGKTLLARGVVASLDRNRYRAALLVDPLMPVPQLLATILRELGLEAPPRRKSDILDAFVALLAAFDREGVEPVLLVDEAHTLRRQHLEELRMLLNFEANDRKLFHLVLLGLPSLERRMASVPSLAERVTMRCELCALDPSEGPAYVDHRLRIAGADREIFEPEAARRLVTVARGDPRRINLVAAAALYVGAVEGAEAVTPALVDRAAHDVLSGAGT